MKIQQIAEYRVSQTYGVKIALAITQIKIAFGSDFLLASSQMKELNTERQVDAVTTLEKDE